MHARVPDDAGSVRILAISDPPVLPSAATDGIGTPD